MFTMDIETLKLSVTDAINGIPVGLHWKMISLGIQGMVKQEDQVKALPIYVNEMDMLIAKLCLVTLYESWPSEDHKMPSTSECAWYWKWIQFLIQRVTIMLTNSRHVKIDGIHQNCSILKCGRLSSLTMRTRNFAHDNLGCYDGPMPPELIRSSPCFIWSTNPIKKLAISLQFWNQQNHLPM